MSEAEKKVPYFDLETLLRVSIFPDVDTLACQIQLEPQQFQVISVRQISSAEMSEIHNALKRIHNFENSCNLYEICESNYESVLSFHSQVASNYPQNRSRADEFMEDTAQEMNRLLLNYLSSFKTFLDHLETRYKRSSLKEHSHLGTFKKMCSTCFDTNFEYRFFSKLRDYIQHCDLPVCYVQIRENPIELDVSICFDRDTLLSNFDGWKKVKNDLINQPKRLIEVMPALIKLRDQIQIINNEVTSIEVSIAFDSYRRLYGLVDEVSIKYPEGSPFIGRSVKPNTPESSLKITNFPFHEMRRFRHKHQELKNLGYDLKLFEL